MFHKIPLSVLFCTIISLFTCFSNAEIDKSRYITIDEIKPGMDAYCLTVYQGVEPAKYNLKVVSVIKNISVNHDAILVMGTDEQFIHSGPVAGCSGSPVYINGKLAGALAFGWTFSKDPLYGVTPIQEMLSAGETLRTEEISTSSGLDFSKPISLKAAYNQLVNQKTSQPLAGGVSNLVCPISTNLPQSSLSNLSGMFESAGFIPVAGASLTDSDQYKNLSFMPGGTLALPLVYGDIDLSAVGTITEVADGKVYAFGHSLLGQGPINVPMATGYVHTVISSIVRSFKYGQPIEIKGALFADESTAVVGTIGKTAPTIPVHIKVDRFNDKVRDYNCFVAVHNNFTPMLTTACLTGTAAMIGDLPPENTVQYKSRINIKGYDPIVLENFSSSNNIQEYVADSIGALNLIMNNPYDRPEITSMDFEVKILPRNKVSHIWNFELSQTKVKPGDTITAKITLESYLAENKTYEIQITIPQDIPLGNYMLEAGGLDTYMQFLARYAPYKFSPENLPGLIKTINEVGNMKRNSLYVMLALPSSGIAVENSELPSLPVTKSLLLKNDKRALSIQPDSEWIEKIIPAETIVLDNKNFMITVEK
ncbi:MAG: SpoIVB peptidase S55 domain-containing protein [Phycisphaerales bacterium]